MGILKGIKRSLSDPRYGRGVALRLCKKINKRHHDIFVNHEGIEITNEEWDNLIILDGCRADIFKNICWFEGLYEERKSQATESQKFLTRNFEGKTLHDTVHVSANPFASDIPEDTFHAFYDLYRTRWDESLQTVTPDSVVDATVEAFENHPNKRFIVHFMQPHYPFIGELGRQIDESSIAGQRNNESTPMNIWSKLMYRQNGIKIHEVVRAYVENLKIVLESVERLLSEVNGRSVITSDHGNLIGDLGYPIPAPTYGHPPDLFLDPLVTVPWFIIDGERREIHPDQPAQNASAEFSNQTRENRLKSLGYL